MRADVLLQLACRTILKFQTLSPVRNERPRARRERRRVGFPQVSGSFKCTNRRTLRIFRTPHTIAEPIYAAGQLPVLNDAERRCRFAWSLAGYVADTGNPHAAIDHRNNDLADLIDQPRLQHGAVEGSSSLEEELSKTQHTCDLVERNAHIDAIAPA